jgi:DNA topoisomerase I
VSLILHLHIRDAGFKESDHPRDQKPLSDADFDDDDKPRFKTDQDYEDYIADAKTWDFDPAEPRDPKSGEWVKGGGGTASKTTTASQHLVYAPNRETWPAHIRKLVVPPAWTEVRISMDPAKPLQVTGRDTKGRLQYLYSQKYRNSQTAAKYKRVMVLDKKYDRLNQQVNKDLSSKDEHTREHALATRLILDTGLRPGSERATGGDVQAYGATTLQASHIVSTTQGVTLEFVGKKGVEQQVPITSKPMQDELRKRMKSGGQVFPTVTDGSLRSYVAKLGGGGFKTKDLRTLKATRIANDMVQDMTPPKTMKDYKAKVKEVAIAVSKQLGNTPTIALQSYINPAIFAPWQSFTEKQQ